MTKGKATYVNQQKVMRPGFKWVRRGDTFELVDVDLKGDVVAIHRDGERFAKEKR